MINIYKSCNRCGKIHPVGFKCNAYRYYTESNTEAARIRHSHKWNEKAKQIKQDCMYLCAVCADNGIYTYDDIEVHHIEKLSERPDKAFDDDNLISLCKIHHRAADRGEISKNYLKELAKRRL